MSVLLHLYRKDYKKQLGTEKGFTLVEVLATLMLYTILLGSVFSLYVFGVNTYRASAAHLDLQQNVRLAVDFISRALRYAYELESVSEHEIKYRYPDDTKLYTLKLKDGELVQLISNTETKISYNINEIKFDWDNQDRILYFNIKGIDMGRSYTARSAVCLQNLYEGW